MPVCFVCLFVCFHVPRHPLSPFPESGSVVAAEQLQRHSVLLGQSPGGDKLHDALEVVEVASPDHLDSVWTAHGGVHLLQDGDGALVGGDARGGPQVHVVHVPTCGGWWWWWWGVEKHRT